MTPHLQSLQGREAIPLKQKKTRLTLPEFSTNYNYFPHQRNKENCTTNLSIVAGLIKKITLLLRKTIQATPPIPTENSVQKISNLSPRTSRKKSDNFRKEMMAKSFELISVLDVEVAEHKPQLLRVRVLFPPQ